MRSRYHDVAVRYPLLDAAAERDGGICHVCHQKRELNEIYVVYNIWLKDGGDDILDNLITVCPVCYDKRKLDYRRSMKKASTMEERPKTQSELIMKQLADGKLHKVSELVSALGIEDPIIRSVLTRLGHAGLAEKIGEFKNTAWRKTKKEVL